METPVTPSRLVGLLDAASRGGRPYLLLLALSLMVLLPGLGSFPVMDRDEPRYAQATKQMLESGDYIVMRNQERLRNQKPVGIYWLQAAAVQAVGLEFKDAIWPYRLPSLVGATLCVLFCFRLGVLLSERRAALLAALLLLCSPLVQVLAHLATAEMVLLCCILVAQISLLAVFTQLEWGRKSSLTTALGFWTALGAGILVKGPIIVAVCGFTGLILWLRSPQKGKALAAFHPWFGLPLLLAMLLPWILAIQELTHGAFLQESLGRDFMAKLISAQESHGAPPGFYLLLLPATFWPAAFVLIPALGRAWASRRSDWLSMVALAWIAPYWVMLALAPTKLVHYMLPLYPALALLAARELLNGEPWPLLRRWQRGLDYYFRGAALAFAALLMLLGIVLPLLIERELSLAGVAIALIAGFYLWKSSGLLKCNARLELTALTLACSLLIFPLAFQGLAPGLKSLWLTPKIVERYDVLRQDHAGTRLAIAGYHEPSLVFSAATDVLLTDPAGVARKMLADAGWVGVVPRGEAAAFRATMDAAGAAYESAGSVSGFNYSKGEKTQLDFYVRRQ